MYPEYENQKQKAENQRPIRDEPIRVDGFGQVLDMLRVADPSFRKSLLLRIAERNPTLARQLAQALGR